MFECCKTKKKQKAFPSNFSWFVVVFFAFKVDRINWKSSYELNGNVIIQRNLEFFLVQQQNCISNTYKNETWKVIQIKEKKKFSIWFVERIYIIYIILSVVVHEDQEITVDWHNMLHTTLTATTKFQFAFQSHSLTCTLHIACKCIYR